MPVLVFEHSVTGALAFDGLVGEWTSDFALLVADRLDLEETGGDTVGFANLMAGPSFVLTAVGVGRLDFEDTLADRLDLEGTSAFLLGSGWRPAGPLICARSGGFRLDFDPTVALPRLVFGAREATGRGGAMAFVSVPLVTLMRPPYAFS